MKRKFFLFGGGPALRTPGQPFLWKFVEAAGGSSVQIAILTAGSEEAALANADYWHLFLDMGVNRMISPRIGSREEANDMSMAQMVADSDAIFIAGGAQRKLIERLEGTTMEKAIRHVFEKGGLMAGTSAGTSLFGHPMILDGGTMDRHLRPNMMEFGNGLNMIGYDTSVDTHCSSRGRFPRIISLLIDHPSVQVIGMDEDTGMLVEDNMISVFGYNAVYVFDARCCRPRHDHLCASGISLHCLTEGDSYDLLERQRL